MKPYQYILDYFSQDDAPDNMEPIAIRYYSNTHRLVYKFKHSNREYDILYIQLEVDKINLDNIDEIHYRPNNRSFSIVFKPSYITEKFYKKYK